MLIDTTAWRRMTPEEIAGYQEWRHSPEVREFVQAHKQQERAEMAALLTPGVAELMHATEEAARWAVLTMWSPTVDPLVAITPYGRSLCMPVIHMLEVRRK